MNGVKSTEEKAKELISIAEAKADKILRAAQAADPPNSILEVKLDYIQRDIGVIKNDIKEIKNDYVTRREYNEGLASIRGEFGPSKNFVYWLLGIFGIAVIGALLKLVIK